MRPIHYRAVLAVASAALGPSEDDLRRVAEDLNERVALGSPLIVYDSTGPVRLLAGCVVSAEVKKGRLMATVRMHDYEDLDHVDAFQRPA